MLVSVLLALLYRLAPAGASQPRGDAPIDCNVGPPLHHHGVPPRAHPPFLLLEHLYVLATASALLPLAMPP